MLIHRGLLVTCTEAPHNIHIHIVTLFFNLEELRTDFFLF